MVQRGFSGGATHHFHLGEGDQGLPECKTKLSKASWENLKQFDPWNVHLVISEPVLWPLGGIIGLLSGNQNGCWGVLWTCLSALVERKTDHSAVKCKLQEEDTLLLLIVRGGHKRKFAQTLMVPSGLSVMTMLAARCLSIDHCIIISEKWDSDAAVLGFTSHVFTYCCSYTIAAWMVLKFTQNSCVKYIISV